MQEIAGGRQKRWRGGLALGGGVLVASGVTTVWLVLAGPGTANAFAAWTPSPTAPTPGQVSSAEAACEAGATAPPPDKTSSGLSARPTQVSLVDTRGPFTLVLFGANASTTLMCVSGPSINSSAQANSQMTEIGSPLVLPDTGQIVVDRLQSESANDGQAYTIAEGSVGPGVTAATLVLSDGSEVVTTTGNGLFLAWWPGGDGRHVGDINHSYRNDYSADELFDAGYRRFWQHCHTIHRHRTVTGELVLLSAARTTRAAKSTAGRHVS